MTTRSPPPLVDADVVSTALATFWLAFASASVIAERDLVPFATSFLRGLASRGKDDDDDDDENDANDDAGARAKKRRAFTVPHAWFSHFYVLGFIVNAALTLLALAALHDAMDADGGTTNASAAAAARGVVVHVLFQVHIARRAHESAFISTYRAEARMHVAGYLVGMAYYVLAPLTFAPAAVVDKILISTRGGGGGALGALGALTRTMLDAARETTSCRYPRRLARCVVAWVGGGGDAERAARGARLALGVALFVVGNVAQRCAHRTLAELRRVLVSHWSPYGRVGVVNADP